MKLLLGLIILISIGFSASHTKENYKNKTIDFIVGYAPGGGYDRTARFLAPLMENKIGASVIVKNDIGGGGLTAINKIMRKNSNEDSIVLLNGSAATVAQLLKSKNVRYDMLQIPIFANTTSDPYVLLVHKKSKFKNIKDFIKSKEIIKFAGNSKTANAAAAALFSEAFNLNSKIIFGYKGSKGCALATLSGEVDAFMATAQSAKKYIKNGDLVPLVVIGKERSTYFEDLPTIYESINLTKKQLFWIDFCDSFSKIGKIIVASPSISKDKFEYLGEILKEILSNETIIEDAKTKKISISYKSKEEIEKSINNILIKINNDEIKKIKHVIEQKYY